MPVPCPLCDQYSGKPESVRAHISAKQDDQHRGQSGFDYDSELGLDQDVTDVERVEPELDNQKRDDSLQIESIERDQKSDGTPVLKLVLAGAGIVGLGRALSDQGGVIGTMYGDESDRDSI
jgi:hypothetical protein